jgi:hypothetical protein
VWCTGTIPSKNNGLAPLFGKGQQVIRRQRLKAVRRKQSEREKERKRQRQRQREREREREEGK